MRRAVSHFLTLHLGDVYHPLRRAVVKAILQRREQSRVPDLSPTLFWTIVDAAPEYVKAAYVSIAALGLHVDEYLALIKEHLLRIRAPSVNLQQDGDVNGCGPGR